MLVCGCLHWQQQTLIKVVFICRLYQVAVRTFDLAALKLGESQRCELSRGRGGKEILLVLKVIQSNIQPGSLDEQWITECKFVFVSTTVT